LLELEPLLDSLAEAFKNLSLGRASVPPRTAAMVPDAGLLAVMPAHLPGEAGGLEVKLVSVFPGNHARGLPSHQAVIALFDATTGSPMALMDGTHITAFRTAAASALATRVLAREDARTLAIIGAGVQGRSHLEALTRARDFTEVRIASRSRAHAEALASGHPGAVAAPDFESAIRGADIVCVCTDSEVPVIRFEWLEKGAHVNSVGSNVRGGELDAETCARGRLVVESRVAFQPPPAGAHELQGLDPEAAAELGEVLLGTKPGRTSPSELTIYKSMGHAVEDAAAARLVFDRARREGAGRTVSL
jgi:ornithine cyclodeaminase/thiomorpholine-carboxylate dehydrogenase